MKSHYKHIKPGWTISGLTLFPEDGNRSIRGAARRGYRFVPCNPDEWSPPYDGGLVCISQINKPGDHRVCIHDADDSYYDLGFQSHELATKFMARLPSYIEISWILSQPNLL